MEDRKQDIKGQYDVELIRKDGTRLYASVVASPFIDSSGNYMGAIAAVQDITERKKLEQLKDEFIGLVSHEIRSPLTVIIGAINTALSEGARLTRQEIYRLLRMPLPRQILYLISSATFSSFPEHRLTD